MGGVVVAVGLVLWGGYQGLRRLSFFDIRRVELVGGHYLTPAAVARALRVPPGASIFDDLDPLVERVQAMRGVREARIARRLPGSIRVTIREVEAVALTERDGRLVPLDVRGRPLPFDPTRPADDLPLAPADSAVAAVLALIRDTDPGLFRAINRGSRIRQDVALELAGGRVLFRADASSDEVRDLALIVDLLAREGRAWRELDARFTSRIVVRGKSA
jgi:cell division septal protein FtsQ